MDLTRSSTLKPGTTVLVVGYNHQNYIGETLTSIKDQTLPPAAVLITDDASPGQDETAKIVQSHLAAAPETWTWLPNESNMGLNATLNRLLALVDTEFVAYIAADDTMLSNRIEVQSGLLKNSDSDTVLAYSDAHVIDKDSHLLFATSRREFPWPDEPQRSNQTLECLVESDWIPAASMFMRTAALREAGGYAEDLFYEDFELLLRLAKEHKFTHTEQPLVQVRRLDDSLGTQGFAQDSPRFLRAVYVALGHALDTDDGLTPFFRSGGSGSRPVARGCGQGDWSDHVEHQEASHPGAGRPQARAGRQDARRRQRHRRGVSGAWDIRADVLPVA